MIVVTAYRPFVPESASHVALGPFDWVAAIRMLRVSVRASCGCHTVALSDDAASAIPEPVLRFETRESRLMLWLLEVWLAYLQSDAFTEDTVMVSPDILVYQDLRPYFRVAADLGVVVRDPVDGRVPLLNGIQFWSHAGRDRLVSFYERALVIARTLSEDLVRWGADTTPLIQLLSPLRRGWHRRSGLSMYGFSDERLVTAPTASAQRRLAAGRGSWWPETPFLDFRFLRKRQMAAYFDATYGSLGAA